MKTFAGIKDLVANKANLPDVGWLFVDKTFDLTSRSDIQRKNFYLAENDDEEIAAEKMYRTWLESPTFLDVLNLKTDANPNATLDDVTDAAIYYLEHDTFMD